MDTVRRISGLTDVVWDGGSLVSSLTEVSSVFLFSYSPSSKSLTAWSDNALQVLGVADATIARDANLFLRHVHPEDRFLLLSELERGLEGKSPYRATYRWLRPDNNEERWIHCRAKLVARESGGLFEGIMLDVTNELAGPIGRLAGPDSLNTILAAFPSLVFTLDRDLRLLRLNRPMESPATNFGDPLFKPDFFKIGRAILDCFGDDQQRAEFGGTLNKVLEGTIPNFRTRIFYDNSVQTLEVRPLEDRGAIEGLLCILSDVTELVKLESELAELHKTEGLRLLAAGVAHHFNNSLQSIIGHAAVINANPGDKDLALRASQAIIATVNKSSELTRQLLAFEGSASSGRTPVDVNLSVMAAANKIEDLFSVGFKVGVVFGNVPPVLAVQSELSDAIQAVLANAKESMCKAAGRSGHISVRTQEVMLHELEVSDLKAGSYVKISIADSGAGMRDETKRRCFEPFFTTKEPDPASGINLQGSGLGLSRAFSVIRQLHGSMSVESQPGLGTTLSIYLPACEDPAAAGAAENAEKPREKKAAKRSTAPDILIIDDDAMVLKTISAVLSELGLACVTADDYSTAVSLVKNHRSSLQLILLDAVMPGMNGATVLKRIKKVKPDIDVIGFSGASAEETAPLLEAGALQILRKPMDPRALKNVVRQVLSGKKAA